MSGRNRIPGLDAKGEAGLAAVFTRFDKRLGEMERKPTQRKIQSRDFFAREGETITIEAPARGLNATLVRASKFNKGARVTFIQLTAAPVIFRAVSGLVNGKASVKSNAPGTYDAVSDGRNGWSLSQGITEQGVVGAEGTPGAVGATGPAGPPGATGASGGGGSPGTGSDDGYLSRIVYVNAASARIGTTFAGVTCEATPGSWTTDADIPDGNWFDVRVAGPAGGGAGAGQSEGKMGPGGGGGARMPPRLFSRADLVAMLPITITCGLGGAGGAGRQNINLVDIIAGASGSNGSSASVFGPISAGAGSGGGFNAGRHGGCGGGVESAPTPTTATTAAIGGAPAITIGLGGIYLEGAGHPNTSAGGGTGLAAVHGGASGGSINGGAEGANPGGRSVFGGGGGGSGRSTDLSLGAGASGGDGGGRWTTSSQTGGGGAGGPGVSNSSTPAAASAGADGDIDHNGNGGGGGGSSDGNTTVMTGGAGGAGGFPGGGGGGGGATRIVSAASRTITNGSGAAGADGCVIITAYA
jgi:hypothetical protein